MKVCRQQLENSSWAWQTIFASDQSELADATLISFAFCPGEAALELVEFFFKHLNFWNILLIYFAFVLSEIADATLIGFAFCPGKAVLKLVEFFLKHLNFWNILLTTFALVLSELADAALRGWDVFVQLFCPKGLWSMKKKTNAMQIFHLQDAGFSMI